MALRNAVLRDGLAWLSFPVLMGSFVAVAAWGLERRLPAAGWGAVLTVANFFTILAVEKWLPRNPAMGVFRDRQSPCDIGHGLLLTAARPLGGAASVAILGGLGELRAGAPLASAWPAGWPFALQFLLALLVWTFADYWVHRSLHRFDRLWWFHSIHHDTPQMHVLKSGRIHLGEEILNAATKPLPLLLLGAPPEIMVLVGLWIVFDGNLVHSNIDQRFPSFAHYFLPTVQLHNLHHARDRRTQDTNYSGSSAIWDVLFGTFSHPHRVPQGPLGIEASPVPTGFLAQLVFPFRQQWRHGAPGIRAAAALLLCLLVACASRNGPVYPDFAAAAPPIPPGRARLVVYRTLYTQPQAFEAQITVDGAPVGTLPIGTWLWVDQPAGLRRVDSPLWPAYSAFGDQQRTRPIEVELPPGTTSFVSVTLFTAGPVEVVLEPVAAGQAQRDLATLEMAPPPGSP